MRVLLGNAKSTLAEATPDEQAWLRDYLTVEEVTFYSGKRGIAKRCLLDGRWAFPSGLLPLIEKQAQADGLRVDVLDARVVPPDAPPPAAWPPPGIEWLHDFQRDAVRAVCERTRGLIWHGTGSGKGEIVAALAVVFGCKGLVLVPSISLVNQTADRIARRIDEPVGRIGGGSWTVGRFTVATFQSLWARWDDPAVRALITDARILVADECHSVPAQTVWHVTMAAVNAYWRVGLSATPLARGDKKSVFAVGALGPVIHRVENAFLVERGFVSQASIVVRPLAQAWAANGRQRKYAAVYRDLVVRSAARNALVIDTALRAERPAFVFVKAVEHGKHLAASLRAAGLAVDFVDGKAPIHQREAAVAALQRADLDMIVTTVVFQTGVDVPDLRAVINAASGKSVISSLQRIGRGMRVAAGKSTFQVWDILDIGEPWLAEHASDRVRAYQNDGHVVRLLEADGRLVEIPAPRRRKKGAPASQLPTNTGAQMETSDDESETRP